MKLKKFTLLLLSLILFCFILSGCGEKIQLSAGEFSLNSRKLSLIIDAEEVSMLDKFEKLKSADLSGSDCYEEIFLWQQEHPEVSLKYSLPLYGENVLLSTDSELTVGDDFIKSAALDSVAENLAFFPQLESIKFASASEDEILQIISSFSKIRSDLSFDYEISISGKALDYNAEELHLEKLSSSDAEKLSYVITAMPELKTLYLGSDAENPELSFADIAPLVSARPDLVFDYKFTAFDKELTLMDKELDLKLIKMYDEGQQVREIISCMPKLEFLDMDSCGVSDEAMASIRDDFPDVKVVWRIWFGNKYTARTDAKKILASKPSVGGGLVADNTQSLKYCTELRALDLGHNEMLDDISFLSYMPDMEVLLIPMQAWTDASPIADCPNIEYLEIQTTNCKDLSPLKNLKKLRHLNIGHLYELDDISPIYDLDLERLWIGCVTPIPQEQVDEFQKLHPNCKINTTTYDPTDGGWRYITYGKYGAFKFDPRYEELRKTMGYDEGDMGYNFLWSDPIAWADYNGNY